MQRLLLILILFVSLAACGGRQRTPATGGDMITGDRPTMMGALEERSRGFLLDMAFVLEANLTDGDEALRRMEAFLQVNRSAMLDNAAAVEARYESLESLEARIYEAQLAEFLEEALHTWHVQLQAFTQAYPDRARDVVRLVDAVDGA